MADYSLEQSLLQQGYPLIAGIDEAGRGPWAGPVVAAAVIVNQSQIDPKINDSKKLTSLAREQLYTPILKAHHVGIGMATVEEIDQLNILQATKLAMLRAVKDLPHLPTALLIDGNQPINTPIHQQTVVKGDQRSVSIAAASIIAKVYRDRLMQQLASQFPQYHWQTNKGYGTKDHQLALKNEGITPHHRQSFKPIKQQMAMTPVD